jgi:hypothetical protein
MDAVLKSVVELSSNAVFNPTGVATSLSFCIREDCSYGTFMGRPPGRIERALV